MESSLTQAEAVALLASHDLIAIGSRADQVRRQRHGPRTTFVRVLELHVDAPSSSAPANLAAGEIRIIGRPASVDAAVAAVRSAASFANNTPVTGFTLEDLQSLSGEAHRSLADVCRALRAAGMDAVAEIAIDTLGDFRAVEEVRAAGLAAARLVVRELAGDARIDIVERARDLQAAVGGFQAFAPLPRTFPVSQPSTGFDDVKQVALARLLVSNIDSIQVDWPLYGPKLAQVALTVGADDVDGIAAVEPGILGTRRSAVEEIRGNIRAAALDPIERNARFEPLA
jgi:aminodeoxyfutalosine synthase